MNESRKKLTEYENDQRVPCKYGTECYQKNSAHHLKYKHPPKRKIEDDAEETPSKKQKPNESFEDTNENVNLGKESTLQNIDKHTQSACSSICEADNSVKPKISNDISDSDEDEISVTHCDKTTHLGQINADKYKENQQTQNNPHNLSSSEIDTSVIKNENNSCKTLCEDKCLLQPKILNDISDSDDSTEAIAKLGNLGQNNTKKSSQLNETDTKLEPGNSSVINIFSLSDKREFIKTKFLVDMPEDFYDFWNFSKTINKNDPLLSFKSIGLTLVGPFDVLADKFNNLTNKNPEEYLLHWRYFYDPPEFQTVLKGDDRNGYHIGYFRDSPKELPVFLAYNCANVDGTFFEIGDNIFAAVSLYLENLKKAGDPFKKMHISRFQALIKGEAKKLKLSLVKQTLKMKSRNSKIVTRTFNKIGLVVPYNKKTQIGYRELALSDETLKQLFAKLAKASPDQKDKLLAELQPVLTYANIATDECDFGTGLELGLNILCSGVESLNSTAGRFLATSYRLIGRDAFALIAEAHMKNRKKGLNLSIL